ncbi:MAG TPA: hypothetical protein VJ892_04505 [Candidatus Absconditabacterales bacterium]|nr:hypothetical protein [Candidatus Absconditabacterales bacterium]
MINKIKKDIKELQDSLILEKDPTKQHYITGDIVWINFFGEPTKARIEEIQDFGEYRKHKTGSYIYYWVTPLNRPKIRWYVHVSLFWLWTYIFSKFKLKPPKGDYRFGPGHAVLAGKNEDIFDTKEEALKEYLIQSILSDLDELEEKGDLNVRIHK